MNPHMVINFDGDRPITTDARQLKVKLTVQNPAAKKNMSLSGLGFLLPTRTYRRMGNMLTEINVL